MRTQQPKDYLVLAYDEAVEDILLFIIRGVLTRGEAARAVILEYERNTWGKPMKTIAINLNSANKAGFLGCAHVYELPRPEPVRQEYNYTPQLEYV